MSSPKAKARMPEYDARWFIWTIVVLIASGTMLATYIAFTSATDDESAQLPITHIMHRK